MKTCEVVQKVRGELNKLGLTTFQRMAFSQTFDIGPVHVRHLWEGKFSRWTFTWREEKIDLIDYGRVKHPPYRWKKRPSQELLTILRLFS